MSEQLTIEGLDAVGWRPSGELQFERWEAVGSTFRTRRRDQERDLSGTLWGLADWLNYGEASFGEQHTQALEELDYTHGNLSKIAKVGSEFPRDRRREGDRVTFWKFAELLNLTWDSQRMILDRIEDEGLTTAEVRREAALMRKMEKEDTQEQLDVDDDSDDHLADCPLCGARNSISQDRALAYEKESRELVGV